MIDLARLRSRRSAVLNRLARRLAGRAVAAWHGLSRLKRLGLGAGLVALAVLLVFPASMVVISHVDDNPDFAVALPAIGKSHAVAVSAALITRELEINKWRANDPVFLPGGWLRDMPAFQLGIVSALARLTQALVEEHGAGWTPDGPDVGLNHAAGLLKYPGTVWKFDTSKSWLPTASAEKQYRNAQRGLDLFNQQIIDGTASFDRSPQALALVVEALILDLDDTAAAIDRHLVKQPPPIVDFTVNRIFYRNKGRLYADSIVMREIGRDFEAVLTQRHLTETWTRMVFYLAAAARPKPWMLWSGNPGSSLLPNHLIAQGYPAVEARILATRIAAELRQP